MTCMRCWYVELVQLMKNRAQDWEDQKIPKLAAPYRKSEAAYRLKAQAQTCVCPDPVSYPTS